MARKDTWVSRSSKELECPNNSRHGLRPDAKGGYRCDSCTEQTAGTRSRIPTRWVFVGVDANQQAE